jgi:cytochrome c oxidase subunit 1
VVFFVNIAFSLRRKEQVGNNPWGAGATTLEWTVSSPPPFHTFQTLPRIS